VKTGNEEATDMKDEATNDFVEAVEEGYTVKHAHIRPALRQLDGENLTVKFLNASRKSNVSDF
jgi:hypothetical protein